MRLVVAGMILGLLAGCGQPGTQETPAPSADDLCGAVKFQGLVGQPKSALDGVTLPRDNRVIGPNQPVTMDFRPTRLNVEIGKDGRIARVGCY